MEPRDPMIENCTASNVRDSRRSRYLQITTVPLSGTEPEGDIRSRTVWTSITAREGDSRKADDRLIEWLQIVTCQVTRIEMSIQDSQLAFTTKQEIQQRTVCDSERSKLVLDHIFLFNDSKIMRVNDHARHNVLIMSMI